MGQDAARETRFDVCLETREPPECIEGTVIHVNGLNYESEKQPIAWWANGVSDADRRQPEISVPRANALDGTAVIIESEDHCHDGYAWLDFTAQAARRKS